MVDDVEALIETYAPLTPVPLTPELRLHLTSDVYGLWEETGDAAPPFWAVPWPGGQALARYLLDTPEVVRGRRVLDVASGCGVVAIAAACAGAAAVSAADIDRRAIAVMALNAEANDVIIDAALVDPLDGDAADVEFVLVGDAFYERQLAERMTAYLNRVVRRGVIALVGDIGRTYLPRDLLKPIATFDVPVTADLEDTTTKRATVWRFGPTT